MESNSVSVPFSSEEDRDCAKTYCTQGLQKTIVSVPFSSEEDRDLMGSLQEIQWICKSFSSFFLRRGSRLHFLQLKYNMLLFGGFSSFFLRRGSRQQAAGILGLRFLCFSSFFLRRGSRRKTIQSVHLQRGVSVPFSSEEDRDKSSLTREASLFMQFQFLFPPKRIATVTAPMTLKEMINFRFSSFFLRRGSRRL